MESGKVHVIWLWSIAFVVGIVLAQATVAAEQPLTKPIYSALPTYPEQARKAHVAGAVKLWFVLNQKGEVARSGIISGNSLLFTSALSTVQSWRFRPEAIKPETRYETEFVYTLDIQSTSGEPKLCVSMTDSRRVEVHSELTVRTIE